MRWLPCLLAAVGLAYLPATPGADANPDERVAAYRDYRAAFDAGSYALALPLASRVIELTRNEFGAEAPELANPLSNLGTTYYRMRNYGMALDAYREALSLLDQQGDATSQKLIRPLHGMGAALRGLQRDAEAIVPFKRAIDITRNRDGLFAVAQLPLLKELVACYMTANQYQDAGREQQYAYNVAETAYGKNDLRLLEPLNDYANWSEAVGQYTAARALHARAVQIADTNRGGTTLLAIDGLRGIARSYRLAYINGEPQEAAIAASTNMPGSITNELLPQIAVAPASDGERALRNALQRLAASPTPQPRLHGEVLIDLGDWFLTAGLPSRAMPVYRDAWAQLALAQAQRMLETPAAVVYKPPQIAVSRKQEDAKDFSEQDVELQLDIAADGRVSNAAVANAAAEREAAERAVVSAAKRAIWRPAFRNGEPAPAANVRFQERVYVRKPRAVQ